MPDKLDESNFVLYCAKHYDNPQCSGTEEFYEDLKRIKYIKKLFTRYEITGELKERLILNHIIILNNVFGPIATVRILFFKMPKYLVYLKPFFILLNILPKVVYGVGKENHNINTDEIKMDMSIVEALRKI
jgi:hypothetical protein